MDRRDFLRQLFLGSGALALGPLLAACGGSSNARGGSTGPVGGRVSNLDRIGPLGAADANGVRLPAGFRSRIVAVQGEPPAAGSSYRWHVDPDGGACFAMPDGGWVYVSNSEEAGFNLLAPSGGNGGVGALRFGADGTLNSAYPILRNTRNNCAGGLTPWGTWLSCEEVVDGWVYECDPSGAAEAQRVPVLGRFNHEAVAVHPQTGYLYLTEDRGDGCFYRFRPAGTASGRPDWSAGGVLEVLEAIGDDPRRTRALRWHAVPTPQPRYRSGSFQDPETRNQVVAATRFNGGEGIWYHAGLMYFTSKGDNCVWCHDLRADTLDLVYDDDWYPERPLSGVDNITVSQFGDVLVAEDGGNMELVVVTPERAYPLCQVEHADSEIAGPAFSPDGSRLYFSSQRGPSRGGNRGVTFEITGPFFRNA
ncbi:translocation protein TolB [Solimonas fluminis]|uniref:Translocation protein TolB n=1 Tax=Solimonas fluminis TaxID=2086571 RepID=A0A2S5TE13_9GAMM|nr:alkaline phosphatase PhoX [Solimonas fluminis]PPE73088.1 translocation protein TolB [Solimonas fluminis]